MDYYNENKSIPSYEMACQYAELGKYPDAEIAKKALSCAYDNALNINDGDFPQLLKILKQNYNELYIREKLRHVASNLASEHDISDINDYINKMAVEIKAFSDTQTYSQGSLGDTAKQRMMDYKKIEENPDLAKGVYSGFARLDEITNGFKGSELVAISGPSGSGKSIILMNIAVNAWLGNNKAPAALGLGLVPETQPEEWDDSGKNVWFVTIENPRILQERRISSCIAGVSCNGIRDGKLDRDQKERFFKSLKFQKMYSEKKVFYTSDLGQNITMATIEAEYEKISRIFKPDIIVIDYMGKMKAVNPTGQDWLDQGSVAADMYEFAKKLVSIPVITATQMKAAVRTNSGLKRYEGDVENVSRSKMIGDNLSLNLQIIKDELYNQSEYMEIVVAKCRDGETGVKFELIKEFWRQTVCDPLNINFSKSGIDAAVGT